MDSVLRQSKAMCPFMKSASPATLRALSTSAPRPSPGGGTMSKLQLYAHRCPVMGKAMAVQTKQYNSRPVGLRAFSGSAGHGKAGRAGIHTSRGQEARAVDAPVIPGRDKGTCLAWMRN